jgi:hypothetical protein
MKTSIRDLVAGTYQTQRRFGKNAPPWKKSRRLVQSKTPANEIDIADGLVDFPATSSIRFFGSKNLFPTGRAPPYFKV